MGNITDDIRQHFDTFAELPFTEADSLALSQLAYARMPDNVPRYHENAETADGHDRHGSDSRFAACRML